MVCYQCPCLLIHYARAALCNQQCLQDGVHCTCLQVDVVSKRCQGPGCQTRASFGFPGGKVQFCEKHKSADMVCYRYTCLLVILYKLHCIISSACKMVYTATVFWDPAGGCCFTALPGAWVHDATPFWLARRQGTVLCKAQNRRHGVILVDLLRYLIQAALCDHQCMQDGVHCDSVPAVPAGGYYFQTLPGARVHQTPHFRLPRRPEAILFGAQVR